MKAYKFSNGGPYVGVGEIACVSGWDIMHDEAKYDKPFEFDGLRFIKDRKAIVESGRGEMRGTQFSDASKDYPVWGYGSKVW